MQIFIDTAENFHPYECNGPGKCRHCDRSKTDEHDPEICALCHYGEDDAADLPEYHP